VRSKAIFPRFFTAINNGHGLILVNWLPHSVVQAMPPVLLNWSSYPMKPIHRPSRFLIKFAKSTITVADRAQTSRSTPTGFTLFIKNESKNTI
jgi:hypothetical protein